MLISVLHAVSLDRAKSCGQHVVNLSNQNQFKLQSAYFFNLMYFYYQSSFSREIIQRRQIRKLSYR